jgi:hypothetical protein
MAFFHHSSFIKMSLREITLWNSDYRLPRKQKVFKNSFPNKHSAQRSCNGMFTVMFCVTVTWKKKLYWNNDNYLFVTKDTKTSSPQFLVTTSRKCEWIKTNYLTHSETQQPVTSVSSFAALENSMRVYAPSCFTFQHSKHHTTIMRGYFTASSFQQKKVATRNKRTLNKIQHGPLTDPNRSHQVQWHTTN